ncbi:hypothetical protein ACFS5M_12515 [Lacinutrix iliipiscaria]|uniref:Phage protein n=1 Tax=Lacinutrix iliipiscaria TaxID=1230532 RepID=A0ABW5WRH8_9FLAO
MTTNINKLRTLYDMQVHTAKKVDTLLSNHLPFGYTKVIKERALSKGLLLKTQRVREVKSLLQKDLQILNLLIEFAQENQAVAEAGEKKLKSLLEN